MSIAPARTLKVIRVHKPMGVANDTSFMFHHLVFFPVDWAEISHMNRQQNSSRSPSQLGHRAPII